MPENFFLLLKKAREDKNISLAEISDATLISLKMLEALERGDTRVVPQAYIRAFIREYATVVDLDKNEIINKYDAWLDSTDEVKTAEPTPQAVRQPREQEKQKPSLVEPVTQAAPSRNSLEWLVPMLSKIALAIGVLVLLNIVLWNWLGKDDETPTKETPFRDIVKQHEANAAGDDTTGGSGHGLRDSIRASVPASFPSAFMARGDSLTLVASTTDSVWLEIVADDDILTEHYLQPNSRIAWRAKNEFWITSIGNPDAIKFTLNNKPISFPFKRGMVARDIRVTRDSVFVQRY
jgi:transcriptional regulator with XRE-family HTH domain